MVVRNEDQKVVELKIKHRVRFMEKPMLEVLEVGGEIVKLKYHHGTPKYFSGRTLFELKATHGIPLDISLREICGVCGLTVRWDEFIEAARENKRWDFQTFDELKAALEDTGTFHKYDIEGVLEGFKHYVLQHPHPGV